MIVGFEKERKRAKKWNRKKRRREIRRSKKIKIRRRYTEK